MIWVSPIGQPLNKISNPLNPLCTVIAIVELENEIGDLYIDTIALETITFNNPLVSNANEGGIELYCTKGGLSAQFTIDFFNLEWCDGPTGITELPGASGAIYDHVIPNIPD